MQEAKDKKNSHISLSPASEWSTRKMACNIKNYGKETGQGVTEWDRLLGPLLFAYKDSVHEATGFTMFQLLFGRTV